MIVTNYTQPNAFSHYLVSVAITSEWIPWAEFVDRAHCDLIRLAPPSSSALASAKAWANKQQAACNVTDPACPNVKIELDIEALVQHRLRERTLVDSSLDAWRECRERVMTELERGGLAATVERTDQTLPITEHYADTAGLVRVHRAGDDDSLRRELPCSDYDRRMHDTYGLTPCEGLPRTLRGFCGQFRSDVPRDRMPFDRPVTPPSAPWLDHTRTWLDAEGFPVLTTEPYQFDMVAVARELGSLPLTVETASGVWSERTTLFLLRWDCEATPLPAEHKTAVWRIDYAAQELVTVYV